MEGKTANDEGIKTEVIRVLKPIFGQEVEVLLEKYYDSNNPKEILDLAFHMLTGYMDEKIAENIISGIKKKFPNINYAEAA